MLKIQITVNLIKNRDLTKRFILHQHNEYFHHLLFFLRSLALARYSCNLSLMPSWPPLALASLAFLDDLFFFLSLPLELELESLELDELELEFGLHGVMF